MKNKLLSLIFLTSCGVPVVVSGKADLDVNIKLDTLTVYFQAYCEEEFPYDLLLQEKCVTLEIGKFLKLLGDQ